METEQPVIPTETNQSTPALSIVVIILVDPPEIQRCLQALSQQRDSQDIEILVPCDDRVPNVSLLRKQFPTAQFLKIPGVRTYAELRSFGIQKARGHIVAITEDQCVPADDWCAQILNAHKGPHAVVGGAVEKKVPDTNLNWAFYFADYVRYMNPKPEGLVDHLTDCNVSYKREALDPITSVWRREFHEPEVHGALQARGERLWFAPKMIVFQQRRMKLGPALKDRFVFGRLFGSGRMNSTPLLHRLFWGGMALLLPPLTVSRVAQQVFTKRRCVKEFLMALPAVLMVNTVWALGECVGYVTGRSSSALTPGLDRKGSPAEIR